MVDIGKVAVEVVAPTVVLLAVRASCRLRWRLKLLHDDINAAETFSKQPHLRLAEPSNGNPLNLAWES